AAAARSLADAHPARDARVAVGHVRRRPLVAREDVLDAVVEAVERIVQRHAGVTAKTGDITGAMALEDPHGRLRARDPRHRPRGGARRRARWGVVGPLGPP